MRKSSPSATGILHMHIYTVNSVFTQKKLTGIMTSNTNIAALPRGRVLSYYF